jgi:hypothetical protein
MTFSDHVFFFIYITLFGNCVMAHAGERLPPSDGEGQQGKGLIHHQPTIAKWRACYIDHLFAQRLGI